MPAVLSRWYYYCELTCLATSFGTMGTFISDNPYVSVNGGYAWQSAMVSRTNTTLLCVLKIGSSTYTLTQFDVCFSSMEPIALASIKLSLLFFYRRIFISQAVHYIIWALVGIVVVWSLSMSIGYLVACSDAIQTHYKMHCHHSMYTLGNVYAIVDTIVDFVILIIPITLVNIILQNPPARTSALIA